MGSKKSGRYKPAYNAAVHADIVRRLNRGAYQVHAANAAGVSMSSFEQWLAAGRNGIEPYVAFARDVDAARALDAIRNQNVINAAAAGTLSRRADWKAAAWNLERKFPKLYARGRGDTEREDDRTAPAAAVAPGAAAGAGGEPAKVHSPWLSVVK